MKKDRGRSDPPPFLREGRRLSSGWVLFTPEATLFNRADKPKFGPLADARCTWSAGTPGPADYFFYADTSTIDNG